MGCKSSSTKPSPRATFRGNATNRLGSLPLAGLGGSPAPYPYSNSARGRTSLDGTWDDNSPPRGHGYIIGEVALSSRRAPTSNMMNAGDASTVFSDAEGFDSGGHPQGEEVYTDGSAGNYDSNPVVRSGISSDEVSEVLPDEECDPMFRVRSGGVTAGGHRDVEEIEEDGIAVGEEDDEEVLHEEDALETYCAWDPTLRVPSAEALALAPLASNNPFLRIRSSSSLGFGLNEKKANTTVIDPLPREDGEPNNLVADPSEPIRDGAAVPRPNAVHPPAPASPPYLLPTEPSSTVFMFPPSSFELYSTGTLHHRIVANRLSSSYGSSEHGMNFCAKCPKCKLCPIHVPLCSATDSSHLEFHRHRYSSRGRGDCTLAVGLLGFKRAGLLLNEGVWKPVGNGSAPVSVASIPSPASSSNTSGPPSPAKKKGLNTSSTAASPPRITLSLQAFHALLWRLGTTISEPLALLILLKLFYAFQTLRWLGVAVDPSRLTGADVILSLGSQFRTSRVGAGAGGLGQWLGAGAMGGAGPGAGARATNATAEWLAGAIMVSSDALAETALGPGQNTTLSEARLRNYLGTADPQQGGDPNFLKQGERGAGFLDCASWDIEVQILFSNSTTTPTATLLQQQRDQERKVAQLNGGVEADHHHQQAHHLASRGDSSGIRTIPHTASVGGSACHSPPGRSSMPPFPLVHTDGTVGFPLWMLLPTAASLVRPPTAHGCASSTSTPRAGSKPSETYQGRPLPTTTHPLPPFLRWDFWEEALQIPTLAAAVLSSKTRATAAQLLLVVCRMYRPPLALRELPKDAPEEGVNHSIQAGGLPELYEPVR